MKDYLGLAINAAENGCVLDLRMKLAIQFINSGALESMLDWHEADDAASGLASLALSVATQLVELGERTGLIHDLPPGGVLSPDDRAHVERNAAAQVVGQLHANRVMQEEASRVVPIPGRMVMNG